MQSSLAEFGVRSVYDAAAVRSQNLHHTVALNANTTRITSTQLLVNDNLSTEDLIIVNSVASRLGFTVRVKQRGALKQTSPHPVSNTFKRIAKEMAYGHISGTVRNIGASAVELFDSRNTHCCQITLDLRQQTRNQVAYQRALRILGDDNANLEKKKRAADVCETLSKSHPTDTMCNKGAQHCFFRATNLVGFDSLYDITPEQLETIFMNSHAIVGYFAMLLPAALVAGRNNGSSHEVSWQTTRRGTVVDNYEPLKLGDRIAFSFGNNDGFRHDGSAGYEHCAINIRRWATLGAYQGRQHGLNFLIERTYYGNIALLTIRAGTLPVTVPHMPNGSYRRTIFPDHRFYLYLLGKSAITTTQYHDIATDLFKKLLSYGVSRDPKVHNFHSFAAYVKAQATTITIGGATVLGYDMLDVKACDDPDWLASIWFQVLIARNRVSKAINKLRDAVDRYSNTGTDRDKTLFEKFGDVCLDAVAVFKALSTTAVTGEGKRRALEKIANNMRRLQNDRPLDGYYLCFKSRQKALREVCDATHRFFSAPYKEVVPTIKIDFADGVHHVGTTRALGRFQPHFAYSKITPAGSSQPGAPELLTASFIESAIAEYRTNVAQYEVINANEQLHHGADQLQETIKAACEFLLRQEVPKQPCHINIITGGPGTGKTHHIISNLHDDDIILVATAETREELTNRINEVNVMNGRKGLRQFSGVRVYTPHACVKHARDKIASAQPNLTKTLWVDEAFLQHPGLACFAALVLNVEKINVIGDHKQITHKDFNIGKQKIKTHIRWNDIVDIVPTTILRDNYRLPDAHVHAVNARFGYDMTPKTGAAGTCNLLKVPDLKAAIAAIPQDSHVVTKQQYVKTLVQAVHKNVNTIHEAQGLTKRDITFILTPDHVEQFNEEPGYWIVALTRHTNALTILLVDGDYANLQLPHSSCPTIEALLDLSVPVVPVTMQKPQPLQATSIVIAEARAHRPATTNYDFDVATETLRRLWITSDLGGEDANAIHSIIPQNAPRPACLVRVKPHMVKPIKQEVYVSRLTDYPLFQQQDSDNAAFSIHTWMNRNASGRKIPNLETMVKKTPEMRARVLKLFFKEKPKPLTDVELQEAMVRVLANIQVRGKQDGYAKIIPELYDIDKVSGFIKSQLKVKVEPTDADFTRLLADSLASAKPSALLGGKAGQGVAAHSKARNLMLGAYLNAIEKRQQHMLKDFVLHATGYSDEDLARTLEERMQRNGLILAIKGDDVIAGKRDNDGHWSYYESDQSQFDASFSTLHYAYEAEWYREFGMPEYLVQYNQKHAMKYSIMDTSRLLQLINVTCGNCSGKVQTLPLNSAISLLICAYALDWREVDGTVLGFEKNARARALAEDMFGVQVKTGAGVVGSFVGYLLHEGAVVPDLLRMTGKFLDRQIYSEANIPKLDKMTLEEEGYKEHELVTAWRLKQQVIALRDRTKMLDNEMTKQKTVIANNIHYFRSNDNHFVANEMTQLMNFLLTASQFEAIPYYTKRHVERRKELHFIYYDNKPPEDKDYEYLSASQSAAIYDMLDGHAQALANDFHNRVIRELDTNLHVAETETVWAKSVKAIANKIAPNTVPLRAPMKFQQYIPTSDEIALENVGVSLKVGAIVPDLAGLEDFVRRRPKYRSLWLRGNLESLAFYADIMETEFRVRWVRQNGTVAWLIINAGAKSCELVGFMEPDCFYKLGKTQVIRTPPVTKHGLLKKIKRNVHKAKVYDQVTDTPPSVDVARSVIVRPVVPEIINRRGDQQTCFYVAIHTLTGCDVDDLRDGMIAYMKQHPMLPNEIAETKNKRSMVPDSGPYAAAAYLGRQIHILTRSAQGQFIASFGVGEPLILHLANEHYMPALMPGQTITNSAGTTIAEPTVDLEDVQIDYEKKLANYVANVSFEGPEHLARRRYEDRRSRATAKFEELVAPIAPGLQFGDGLTVVDIGAAPGAMARRCAQFNGVKRVVAVCAPGTAISKIYRDPKIQQVESLLADIRALEPAHLVYCDANDIGIADAQRFIGLVQASNAFAFFKIQHTYTKVANVFHAAGWVFVKPTRSNATSSECYAVNYYHPLSQTIFEICARQASAITDPPITPREHPDNILCTKAFDDFDLEVARTFYAPAVDDWSCIKLWAQDLLAHWLATDQLQPGDIDLNAGRAKLSFDFNKKIVRGENDIQNTPATDFIDEEDISDRAEYHADPWIHPVTGMQIFVKKPGKFIANHITTINGKQRVAHGDPIWSQDATEDPNYADCPELIGTPLLALRCGLVKHPRNAIDDWADVDDELSTPGSHVGSPAD
ncbi:replicase [Changjiang hepe-like virus 1]|uniref:replicase n=1 Tax=Changjiang hepe-like virus 1 TaxID=1922772 RepID=UPI00090AF3FC|nr:replicase [Changjiang hepe-like virus 1]APG77607.1 replicase [Changjiang hepe-like virus 1]